MPLPKPNKGESQNDFMSRCISFVKHEDPKRPNDQAVAMCGATWRKSKQMHDISFSYQVPIKEIGLVNDEFVIEGTALNAAITGNGHKFLAEELKPSAQTLKGVPLLVDHRNEVDAIKGRVTDASFDETNLSIPFKANVKDPKIQELINDGRLNSVSVGADVRDMDIEMEGDNEVLVPRGIIFRELSLVAVPADTGATFTKALTEAYKTKLKESYLNNCKEVKMSEEQETPEETKPETTPEKPKEEPKEEPEKSEDSETKEILKNLSKQISEFSERVKKLEEKKVKEADEDEAKPKETPKEEPEEDDSEEEEVDDSEEEEVDEKSGYKVVEGHGSIRGGSFTLVRDYGKR